MQTIAIIKRGNDVVLQGVTVDINIHIKPSGIKSWDGDFSTTFDTAFSIMEVGET